MIKKFIEIPEAALDRIDNNQYAHGSLHRDPETGKIVFNLHKQRIRHKDKLIRSLEHGWVKESPARYKFFESIPKKIGMPSVIGVLERDAKVAKETLIDHEIINII